MKAIAEGVAITMVTVGTAVTLSALFLMLIRM